LQSHVSCLSQSCPTSDKVLFRFLLTLMCMLTVLFGFEVFAAVLSKRAIIVTIWSFGFVFLLIFEWILTENRLANSGDFCWSINLMNDYLLCFVVLSSLGNLDFDCKQVKSSKLYQCRLDSSVCNVPSPQNDPVSRSGKNLKYQSKKIWKSVKINP